MFIDQENVNELFYEPSGIVFCSCSDVSNPFNREKDLHALNYNF